MCEAPAGWSSRLTLGARGFREQLGAILEGDLQSIVGVRLDFTSRVLHVRKAGLWGTGPK